MKSLFFRGVWLVLLLFVVFAATKSLVRAIPGDPIDAILAETGTSIPRETLEKELKLDLPFWKAITLQTRDAISGDFGQSITQKRAIGPILGERLKNSSLLALIALSTGLLIALVLAILSTLPFRAQNTFDRIQKFHSAWVAALPTAWIGPIFAFVFGVQLQLFALGGNVWLPALTLGYCVSGFWTRAFRETLRKELHRDHARAARARGVGELRLLLKYGLYPAAGPLFSYLGTQTGGLLAGAVITETIFDWPGLGALLVESIFKRDYPLIEATIFLSSALILLGNWLGDVAQLGVNPRLREKGSA